MEGQLPDQGAVRTRAVSQEGRWCKSHRVARPPEGSRLPALPFKPMWCSISSCGGRGVGVVVVEPEWAGVPGEGLKGGQEGCREAGKSRSLRAAGPGLVGHRGLKVPSPTPPTTPRQTGLGGATPASVCPWPRIIPQGGESVPSCQDSRGQPQ